MANQLIPPPELAPPVPEGLSSEQRIRLWMDLVDACEQLLLAGFRRELGPEGDVRAAYRRWYARHMEEHDEYLRRLAENFARRGMSHAR